MEYPKTLEQAKMYRYQTWGGNPRGLEYKDGRCAYEVFSVERGVLPCQCSRKNGHGPSGLYCKQHSKRA